MNDRNRTKTQLVEELVALRQRVTELEMAEVERKRVEKELLQSEEKYRDIVELAPDGILMVSLKGVATACNSAFLKITGYSRDEIVGEHISRFPTIRIQDVPRYIRVFLLAARGRTFKPFEFIWIHKDGTNRWGEAHIGLMRKGSRITGLQLILRDITERKRAEERLRLLSSAVEQSSEGIAISDLDGNLLYANHAFATAHGYTGEEIAGKHLSIFHTPDQVTSVDAANRKLQDEGEFIGEILHARRDGTPFPTLMHNSLLRDQTGSPTGMIGTLRDITERKRMEEQLRRHERLAAVGQLSAGIAHDFRNLLTTIILYANMTLLKPSLPQDLAENVQTIIAESKKAAHLVQQILDFSSRSMIQPQAMNMEHLVQDVLDILRRTLPENIHLSLDVSPAQAPAGRLRPVCKVDPNRIEQALMNLSLNARDVMPEGGELRFGLSRIQLRSGVEMPVTGMSPGEWVCLAVSDTGTGMTEKVRAHLFEPFFTTKGVGKGTGLGLAQVYGIVRQHDGYVDVETEVDKGTTFRIYLPSVRPGEESVEEHVSTTLIQGQGETILLVEDNKGLREAGQSLLESLGYRVFTAANGHEALTVCQAEGRPDLLITDMVMPEMGGEELVQQLRRKHPTLKALGITGYTAQRASEEWRGAGFLDVIHKPFDVETLAQVVRRALDAD